MSTLVVVRAKKAVMKPNFALSLSFDGIALLHRAGDADWTQVGEVALNSADLSDNLAALRAQAMALDPSGMATKLIIPEEQIRYLDLPAASAPHGDYDAAAADALDGATPYALADLAFDWNVSGTRLQVAAVARETLEEAEAFALEHGFNPTGFVARPDPGLFDGEPFFGPAESAEAREMAPPALAEADHPNDGALVFASVRAECGAPVAAAPRLGGVARFTPAPPLPEAEVRALSGAAMASLAPRIPEPQTAPQAAPVPVVSLALPLPENEAERLTIFGARSQKQPSPRKSRSLALALTAALVLLMIGVAALASIYPESSLGRLLRGSEPQIAVTPDIPELARSLPQPTTPAPLVATAGQEPAPEPTRDAPAPEVATLPDAEPEQQPAPAPQPRAPQWSEPRTPEEALARYAATGIWPRAPAPPAEPPSDTLDTFYQTSIDEGLRFGDAVALPTARELVADAPPPAPARAPLPGQSFALDARGLVTATPEGALTPSGVLVRTGPPPLRPASMPVRAVPIPDLTPTPEALAARERLSGIRPRPRPENLIEQQERGALGGRSRTELAVLRPRQRPTTLATALRPDTEAIDAAIAEAAEQAVASSLKPRLRPEQLRVAARTSAAPAPTRQTTPEADIEDGEPELTRTAAAAPRIPTSASIAQQATSRNAVNLRQVNLIGVYGTPTNRRALVRLANGRYQKVQVGDRIDGGRVSAIGNDELRYRKGSRDVVLRMPKG